MPLKNLFACPALMLSVTIFLSDLFATDCTIDANVIDRGETRIFIVCGKAIPKYYTFAGLAKAHLTIL